MNALVERLQALADRLDARALALVHEAQRVPVPGSETGRWRVATLQARAEGLREAASALREQVQVLLQVQP